MKVRRGSHSGSDDDDSKSPEKKKILKHHEDKVKKAEEEEGEGSDSDDESEEKPWNEKGWKDKIYWVLNLPLVWIRKVTIPPADKKDFDNYYVIGWPWLGIPVNVCLVLKSVPTTTWWVLYIPIAMVWSGFWYKWIPERHVPPKRSFIIISVVSMICGFIWTNFIIIILVDCITAVGIITKLSATYLALTIIAVGNALPDAIITVALAKKGKA